MHGKRFCRTDFDPSVVKVNVVSPTMQCDAKSVGY